MNPNKKSYAMKMLQLALALSLLHVDPDFFLLQQRFDSWDSQLESYDGSHHGGWELEMLRAVPMVEYPYANRKLMMPLIEDLIHYDRHENQYNVTAYLLTQPNDVTANQTAAVQELQTPAAGGGGTVTATTASPAGAAATSLEQAVPGDAGVLGESTQFDLFLQSEHFQDQRSVWEQNLADLEDFGDLSVRNPYTGLKDEINQLHMRQPVTSSDNEATADTDTAASAAATSFNVNLEAFLPTIKTEPGLALNDTYPDPDDTVRIKVEQLDNDESAASGSENNTNTTQICQPDGGDNAAGACSSSTAAASGAGAGYIKVEQNETYITGLDAFISQHELTNEESEIVEVLWKQDVDLGYSLSQSQLLASVASGELPSGSSTSNGTFETDAKAFLEKSDNIEDLKALDQLKEDKDKPEDDGISSSNDGWANIPFTVDNETGEFIRLPLDEILNDVLEFASLAGEQNEIGNDSIASTSKGSAAAAERKPKSEHNDENNRSGAGVGDDVDVALKDEKDDNFWLNSADSSRRGDRDRTSSGCNKTEYDDNTDNGNDADADLSDLEASSLAASPLFDLDDEAKEELADFDIMLQSAAPPPPPSSFHHPHPHHYSHHAAAGAHHPHRPTATATSGGVAVGQNYAVGSGANSAFQRQAATATGFHHGPHQGRMPLSRGVSMDLTFFNPMGVSEMSPYPHYAGHHPHHHAGAPPPPPPHHHAHYPYQAGVQHAQYPHHHHPGHRHGMMHPNATLGDLCPPAQPHYGHNLGSAVTSSMHLTNTTTQSHHDDLGAAAAAAGGDMMYYSNGTSDMNHTTDGFINSIWNDEDLHLMDMNVTDSFCRIVDVNNSTSNNSSVLGGLSGGHVSGASSATTANSLMGLTGDLGVGGAAAAAAAAIGATGSATAASHGGVHTGQSGTDRLDASSDSAVSSMGSERVPSLSDGEWGEGSDSAQDYHQGKYGGTGAGGPYDYSYQNSSVARQPPVAQKKHQMFGKRFQHEQPSSGPAATAEAAGAAHVPLPGAANSLLHGQQPAASIKYEYDPYPTVANHHQPPQQQPHHGDPTMGPLLGKVYELNHGAGAVGGGDLSPYSLDYSLRQPRTPHDIVQHNHTYTMPQGSGSLPRPQQRDKKGGSLSGSGGKSGKGSASNSSSGASEEEHLTRDEKRARALNVPIPVQDIINLPMDEFNERLSKYDLTESQLSLIRDIRRRGKNKVAAQNCRKRKLDQILSLEDEVKEVRKRKEHLESERDSYDAERKRISSKFAALHRHIFQYLRDPEGNPCSTADYSLQQAADGSIFLLPRDNTKGDSSAVGRSAANQASMQQQGAAHHAHGHQMNGGGPAAQHQQQHQQQQQQHSLVLGGQQRASSHLSNQQPQQQQHALPHALPPHSLHHNSHHTQMPHQKE